MLDDHIKLFLPEAAGKAPSLPVIGPNGIQMIEGGQRSVSRDYTPRRYDAESKTLDIDFAIDENGPATT